MTLIKKLKTNLDIELSFRKFNSMAKGHLDLLSVMLAATVISGCGGGSEKRPCERDVNECIIISPPPPEIWWDAPIPDFSQNVDRPTISLLGDKVVTLSVGETYLEDGAIAVDEQDGDITSDVVINGEVDSGVVGDYLVRYSVTDSSDLVAIEQTRIVRVFDDTAQSQTRRPLGSTISNFAYFEHLPEGYGQQTQEKPPLIIYMHGSGGNLEMSYEDDPILSMDAVLDNNGIPKLIEDGQWDNTLPFVVLAPHWGSLPGVDFVERLDAFVEYAIQTYEIDTNRIYFTGWSSGGYISSAYAVERPEIIAAIAPVASGLALQIDDLPENFCNIEQVPAWFFHGTSDEVTAFVRSIRAYNAIVDTCQPRVIPKLSLITNGLHHIHHAIFDLSMLEGGSLNAGFDPRYDVYDESIYQWLLSHSLADRH